MAQAQFYRNLAKYYDFICSSRKRDVEVLTKLISRHRRSNGKKLLDVACGTGLEDQYLHKAFDVTGVDLHEGVLNIAKKRNPNIRYVNGDMLNIRLREKFDVIICLDALCYAKNHQQLANALRSFYKRLIDGGVLIFYIDETFLKEHRMQKTSVIVDQKVRGDLEVILFMIYRQQRSHLIARDIFHITNKGKTSVVVEPEHVLGLFEQQKIVEILNEIGFRTHLYSNDPQTTFSLQPYTRESAMPIFVCEK